jgi:hypothetical protein
MTVTHNQDAQGAITSMKTIYLFRSVEGVENHQMVPKCRLKVIMSEGIFNFFMNEGTGAFVILQKNSNQIYCLPRHRFFGALKR